MARHLHSRSMSRDVSSSPDKKSIWGLPTPPPSLSGLSALASPESSPRVNTIGPDRPHMTAPDHRRLLPLSYAPLPQPAPWSSLASRLSPAGGVGAWLALYLVCNLALTLHNKHLLNDFPFPWLLTALHAFCAALGSGICAWRGVFKPAPLNHPTTPLLGLFSILYSANIAASNASLRLVSIATHQVVRAATPLFVVLFAWIGRVGLEVPGRVGLAGSELGLTKRSSGLGVSSAKLRSLTPVILGVVFATYGDYSYTRAGLALTMLGTALAALKTMLASRVVRSHSTPSSLLGRYSPVRRHSNESLKHHLDEGYLSDSSSEDNSAPSSAALHPLDVLLRLSPLACMQCLIVAYFSGEASRWLSETTLEWHWRALVINGALAFVLNYVSFVASRRAGALSMTVTANVKQVLTILIALTMFNTSTPPSALHLLGIGLTLGGGVWYGLVEVRERKEREKS